MYRGLNQTGEDYSPLDSKTTLFEMVIRSAVINIFLDTSSGICDNYRLIIHNFVSFHPTTDIRFSSRLPTVGMREDDGIDCSMEWRF